MSNIVVQQLKEILSEPTVSGLGIEWDGSIWGVQVVDSRLEGELFTEGPTLQLALSYMNGRLDQVPEAVSE